MTSETKTLTLTRFLLARIAEDEADAKAALAHERALLEIKPHWEVGYAWAMLLNASGVVGGHNFQQGAPSPDRVLAECKAKRRIVEWHESRDDCCEERYGPFIPDPEEELSAGTDAFGGLVIRRSIGTEQFIGCVTLMEMAAVYADHPDYRDDFVP